MVTVQFIIDRVVLSFGLAQIIRKFASESVDTHTHRVTYCSGFSVAEANKFSEAGQGNECISVRGDGRRNT